MIGHACHAFWGDPLAPCEHCPTLRAFETKRSEHTIMHTPDGRMWDEKGEPIFDAQGNVIAVVEIALDITEREQAEQRLAAAARQWRQTFDAMSDSVALFDGEGLVLRCNAATTTLTGRPFEDIVGRPCYEVFHGAAAFLPDCPQQRALASGQTETSIREQDGRWLRVTFRPLTDEAGRPSGGVHVVSDVSGLKQAERGLTESLAAQRTITEGVIAALVRTVEVRDPYTGGHQRRVGELAAAMALRMELGEERAEGLRVAGLLHDVGMVIIPAEILAKPGRLTTIELELVKGHARAGFEILSAIHFPWPVAEMALQHHERLDGSGYPEGLSGEDVLPEARILAVADVVEAMASHRPYRPALGLEAALAEVRGGGGVRYDPAAVAACEGAFAEGFAFG
jgi:PAS domain S-box-containing protein